MVEPWHKLPKFSAELARAVSDLAMQARTDDAPRLARYRANARRYERGLRNLSQLAAMPTEKIEQLLKSGRARIWNVGCAIVDSTVAEIAGTSQPRIQMVATNSNWSIRRKARKIERLLDSDWSRPQGQYQDLWDLTTTGFRDCALFGAMAVKTIGDVDLGEVVTERTPPWQVFAESHDAEHGCPSSLMHVFGAERFALANAWPEKRGAIMAADAIQASDDSFLFAPSEKGIKDRVLVVEIWKTSDGPNFPGRHVLCIANSDVVLCDHPWEYRESAIELVHWRRPVEGLFGTGIMDDVADADDRLNDMLERMIKAVEMTGIGRLWLREGSVIDKKTLELLSTNEDFAIGYYTGDAPPQQKTDAPFHPQMQQFAELIYKTLFELTGASQMMVTAQKQPGIEANSAILTMGDIQSRRFGVQARQYRQLFPRLAEQRLRRYRELAGEDKNFSVTWKTDKWLQTANLGDIDIDADQYWLEVQPASTQKGSAGWRIQIAYDLFQQGKLNNDQLAEIERTKDLDGELDRSSAQYRFIDRMIENWLDSTEEQRESGYIDDDHEEALVEPPDDFMSIPNAMVQVYGAYIEARADRAPAAIQELFLRWLEMAAQKLQSVPQPPQPQGEETQPNA